MSGKSLMRSHMLLWATKGGFSVLDQGLFAGTNFLVNILLARWLAPAQYGAFAVAYSVFLLLSTFHTAILTEPMLVFGAGRYAERFPTYLGLLLYGHWWITGIISSVLALAAFVLWQWGSADLAWALAGLAIAAPLILLMWVVRRAFYVCGQPQRAATGGVLYLVLMLAVMSGLYHQQWLSAALALVIMGFAGLAVSCWLARLLRPQWRGAVSNSTARMVLTDHWKYGRWATATAALTWLPGSIYYVFLPAWVGLEGSTALRAVMNLVMPMLQASSAIAVLLVPRFVRSLKAEGEAGLSRDVRMAFFLFAVGSVGYWAFLLLFHNELLGWIYGDRYAEQAHLLVLAGLLPLPAGVTFVLGSALRALERPDQIFWCHVAASVVATTLSLWLVATYGVAGAVTGLVASSATGAAALSGMVFRGRR